MTAGNRRRFLGTAGSAVLVAPHAAVAADPHAAVAADRHAAFAAEAQRMKQRAVDAGDQPYGAVVVLRGAIAGYGPSRVVAEADPDAHAERVALRDAKSRLGGDIAGAVLYSTSRPCPDCERAAAHAGIARMYVGADPTDAGAPRQR